MKIYVDTNVLYDDWLLQKPQTKILEQYLQLTNNELCISKVVLDEQIRNYERKYKKAELWLQKTHNITQIIDDNLQEMRDITEATNIYRRLIENRLSDLEARLLPIPDVNIRSLLERDLNEKRPFEPSGKGFRDSIIWESILIDCHSHDEQAVFITKDLGFTNTGDSKEPSLHPDLVSDLNSNGLPEDKIIIINNLKNFNNKYSSEILDRVYRYGDKVGGTFVEDLDTETLLNQYSRFFVKEVDNELERLLSITMRLYERVSLLGFPIDPVLIEAYDLQDERVLATFIVSSLIDAYLFTDSPGYEKLLSYTAHNGKIHFILDHTWDEDNQKHKVKIRFSLHALLSAYWNQETNKGEQAYLVDFSFNRNELWNNNEVN